MHRLTGREGLGATEVRSYRREGEVLKQRRWAVLVGMVLALLVAVWAVQRAGVWLTDTVRQAVTSVPSSSSPVDPGTDLPPRLAPGFSLVNQFGQPASLQEFRGKVVILAFIDSRCTTVCPLTATVLKNVWDTLSRYHRHIQIVAINANPIATQVRDVYNWSRIHGMLHTWQYLTGAPSALETVWRAYAVTSQRVQGNAISHTPAVYVIGPHGHERWLYLNSGDGSRATVLDETDEVVRRVVPLLPGHVTVAQIPGFHHLTVAPPVGPATHQALPFTLNALTPAGRSTMVRVGRGRLTLLEFFATWCPDCIKELPTLRRYWQQAPSARPASLILVDLRLSEPSTAWVRHFIRQYAIRVPVALDTQGIVSDRYAVTELPSQVLVSAQGRVLWYHQGLIGFSALNQAIRTALFRPKH